MLKTVEKPIITTRVNSLMNFVLKFDCEKDLEKVLGMTIKDFDYLVDDCWAIEKILKSWDGYYRLLDKGSHLLVEQYSKGNDHTYVQVNCRYEETGSKPEIYKVSDVEEFQRIVNKYNDLYDNDEYDGSLFDYLQSENYRYELLTPQLEMEL